MSHDYKIIDQIVQAWTSWGSNIDNALYGP